MKTKPVMTETEIVLEVVALEKTFKNIWGKPVAKAVKGIDFKVARGEIFALLGPNGSGKSTTIKMLLDLLKPTKGRLAVFSKSPDDQSVKKRIGYLPEETLLYDYLTAEETLDFFASLFKIPKEERKKRVQQLMEMLGLQKVAKRKVGQFSKGMARRIALAQALINDPELLILDEPTSGLDPVGCREVKDLIKTLATRGKTIFLTSHLLSDVEDLVDRVCVLYGGEVRVQGHLDELLTIDEQSRIVAPQISSDQCERILKILQENAERDEISIDHPKRDLESFFLDLVQQTQVEDNAGVDYQSRQTADYLKGEEKDLLAELSRNKEVKEEKTEPEKIRTKKLEELELPKFKNEADQAPKHKANKDSVNEKLKGLQKK